MFHVIDVDPKLAPPYVTTYAEILAKSSLLAKSVMRLFVLCFGFALLLAVPVMALVGFSVWRFFPVGWTASLISGVLVSAAIVSVVLLATYVPARRVLQVSARDAIFQD